MDLLASLGDTVPVLEITLHRAAARSEDAGGVWIEVMPQILEAFPQITPETYWRLTVGEAVALLAYLEDRKPPDLDELMATVRMKEIPDATGP